MLVHISFNIAHRTHFDHPPRSIITDHSTHFPCSFNVLLLLPSPTVVCFTFSNLFVGKERFYIRKAALARVVGSDVTRLTQGRLSVVS